MNPDPAERSDSQARRRAAVILSGIAVVAVIVALLMITLTRTPRDDRRAVRPSLGTSADPVIPTTVSASRPSSAAATTPSPTTTSCPSRPCVLAGDPGNVVAAVNAFRASAGQPAVTGSATVAAAACAVHNGDAPYCPQSYYWMPVSRLQGGEVVSKIAGFGGGRAWLLDPLMRKIAVGWAQTGPSQYECAVVDVSPPH